MKNDDKLSLEEIKHLIKKNAIICISILILNTLIAFFISNPTWKLISYCPFIPIYTLLLIKGKEYSAQLRELQKELPDNGN